MWRSLGVCTVFVCGCGTILDQQDDQQGATPPLLGERPPLLRREASVFIVHYDYGFDIESRAAHVAVTSVLETPGNCVSLPFRADGFDSRTARIDGALAYSELDGATLRLCGEPVRAAGEELVLEVDLVIPLGTLENSLVGYSITPDQEGNQFYYLASWVGNCDRFGPCDTRPDRFAKYTFRVTHPPTMLVRCPGRITEVSATETTCDFTHDGGPTYSTFGVAAYPAMAWTRTEKGRWGAAKVTLYDRPSTMIADAIDSDYHARFVSFLESLFGPYPFGDELRILTAPTYWSGFEHPGNIVLNDKLARSWSVFMRPVAHVLNHEIVHMWAGNETTLADAYDFVWKEAMAEYLTYVYESMVEPVASLGTAAAWKGFAARAVYFPVPAEKPELFEYYADVYGPGPMILFRQLEVLTSRAQVLAALQRVLGDPRALSVDDLLGALEEQTGLDVHGYAAAWLRGTGTPEWPRVALTYSAGEEADLLEVRLTAGTNRRCKFHVALHGEKPGDLQMIPVDTLRGGADQRISVPKLPFPVVALDLDPFQECLVFASEDSNAPASVARVHPWQFPVSSLPVLRQ